MEASTLLFFSEGTNYVNCNMHMLTVHVNLHTLIHLIKGKFSQNDAQISLNTHVIFSTYKITEPRPLHEIWRVVITSIL